MSGTEPSGTDELFPDATEHVEVRLLARPRSSRGLGTAALVIAIIAVVVDLIAAGVGYTELFVIGLADDRIGELSVALGFVIVVVVLDLGLALLALALGIAAAVTRRGRRLGVVGAVSGGALVIVHVAAIAWFVSAIARIAY